MKLSQVLLKHDESKTNLSLEKNLGDGYLLKNNSIYKIIREKTTASEFKFDHKNIESDYYAFPMSQLENILSKKSLPYIDNVSILKDIDKKTKLTLEWDHVVDNIRPNYIFHESCHAIAEGFNFKTTDQNILITKMLVQESFANTCEFLAIADAKDPLHRLFLEMNSYFVNFEDRTNLKKLIDQLGLKSIFQFMLLTYLHSQFLKEDLTKSDFNSLLEICDIPSDQAKALKHISKNAFQLNLRFRLTTTEMYLRLNGIYDPIEKALNFDFMNLIKNDSEIKKLVDSLLMPT